MALHVSTSRSEAEDKAIEDGNAYRRRLIEGLEASLAEKNFQRTTIADIVRHAHTSRRTFYQYFETKQACLLALHKQASQDEIAAVAAAVDHTMPWQVQIRQATEAWIDFVDTRPALMLSWIQDIPLLGEAGAELHREGTDAFINTIQAICNSNEFRVAGGSPISRTRALVLVGGIERLAAETVQRGRKLATYTDEAVQAALALMTTQEPSGPLP
ncbi:TetR/AcrR family transcriptional regulator [Mycobacteroides salmoniphilum]|uniref:Bacterial regulatory protein, tetR family n=1 Tax=Mycobacteroides salmoniphilum TaxID=404941 RepID=A0A4V6QF85_9MYCO|nr:TetR/AcrR family transcriptional regulator [Mycobacteroides salmoniphilum]TDZ90262.1 Bacterial regulatory protein, tetR family [Mycobacteroides salmoniphilum]TEA00228.1 Bacterial regulatory protein, tetR family [Mycobacteroides salmoniphilum]